VVADFARREALPGAAKGSLMARHEFDIQ